MTKEEKIKELLEVLDMSEDGEMDEWIYGNTDISSHGKSESLADLAFRMRRKINIESGMVYVDKYLHYRGLISIPELTFGGAVYFATKAKEIEIIIAAKIAEVLEEKL